MPIASFCADDGLFNWDSDAELKNAATDLNSQINSFQTVLEASKINITAFLNDTFFPFATSFRQAYNRDQFTGIGRKTELCDFLTQFKQIRVDFSKIDPSFDPDISEPETSFDIFWRRHKTKIYIGVGILGVIFLGPPLIRILSAKRKGRDVLDVSAEELEALRSGTLSAGRSAASATGRGLVYVGRGTAAAAKAAAKGATKGALMIAAPEFAPITAMAGAPKRRRRKRR
jgi:hypothetical protein